MKLNRQFLFGLLAGVVVVGLLLFSVWLATGRQTTQPRREGLSERHQSARVERSGEDRRPDERHGTQDQSANTPTPPWAEKGPLESAPVVPNAGLRKPGMGLSHGALPMTADGQIDIAAVNTRIDALIKRNGGNPVIRGVDFSILKKNMEKAQELQGLAKEIQSLDPKKNSDMNKLKELTNRMKALQQEIQNNFTTSGLLPKSSAQ